ncbi:hypothetical protein GF337_04630, partial [candidate division KSB1 bacterium]|nr:hypothetical protein [candidate division KSB1 bacterium]
MKHIAFIAVVFCSSLYVSMSNSFAQDESSGKWFDPLRLGFEHSNITDIGPVIQYNVFKSLHVTCKLQYNTDIEDFFVLPGIKYNFKQIKYGL